MLLILAWQQTFRASRASPNAQGMSYFELGNPRNLASGGVFGHFVAAVPSKGDGLSLWMSIWE